MVELVNPAQQKTFDQDAKNPHHKRRGHQHHPVVDVEIRHGHPGQHSPHHEQRTVRKINDVEQPENHREPQAEDRVKRPIHQPQQELAQQAGKRNIHDGG